MTDNEFLETAEKSVEKALSTRAKIIKRASLFVKVGLISIGSAVVGIAQLVQVPTGGELSSWQVVGIFASMAVALGGIFAVWTEHDATDQLFIASDAIDKAKKYRLVLERHLQNADDILDDFLKYIEVYQSVKLMRDVLEASCVQNVSEEKICELMLRAAQRSLRIAMDFHTEDQGTVCIYMAETMDNRTLLRCVAHWREIPCEVANARSWEEGKGIAGISFANSTEIIVPDLQADGVRTVFGGSGAQTRSYDIERYRSMVAVPVLVQGISSMPWGVVVATNNRVDHFSVENADGLKPDEAVRALANMVALGVALCRTRTGKPPNPASLLLNGKDIKN